MSQLDTPPAHAPSAPGRDEDPHLRALRTRLHRLERLIRRLEDELADDELDDEQKLQSIGERIAAIADG